MSGRFRPKRRMRSELGLIALALSVPVALWSIFPTKALGTLAVASASGSEPSCAFVSLSPTEERAVRSSARAAWQQNRQARTRANFDLFADVLPPSTPRPVLDSPERPVREFHASLAHASDLLPPTMSAPAPAAIAPLPGSDAPQAAFSRDDLLELN